MHNRKKSKRAVYQKFPSAPKTNDEVGEPRFFPHGEIHKR